MDGGVVWESHPDLRTPILVAAFSGWNDAGDSATAAADWLRQKSPAPPFAPLAPRDAPHYQTRRPVIELVDGVMKSVTWPIHEYFAASFANRDLVVLRGVEPNVRWKDYCHTVISVADEMRCAMVVTFGALLGDVPHTRRI